MQQLSELDPPKKRFDENVKYVMMRRNSVPEAFLTDEAAVKQQTQIASLSK